jgi:AcrR family transcriptional regulator
VGTRTPRQPLSRERVLTAAVGLADTEGLPAVTMRRLAAALGVEAMSLYYHLPGKDGPIAARESPGGTADDDWRSALRRRCLSAREVMLRHPWAPGLMGSRATIPVGVYAHYEAILAALIGGGFSYHLAHRALHALGSMALGFVQEPFSPAAAGGDAGADPAEADLAQLAEALPHLTAMVAAELHAADDDVLGWCDSQAEFEFTLGLLLDGLAAAHAAETPAG